MGTMPDLEAAKAIVVEAGDRALVKAGRATATFKADTSVVTEVDMETERFLSQRLSVLDPGIGFMGEEYGVQSAGDGRTWACDPIDGTANFVAGLPHWGVSAGLLADGVPVMGVFYLPVTRELFWGELGEGAWLNGRRLHGFPDRPIGPEDTLCFSSNSVKTLEACHVLPRIRCLGSIAAELAYTASGALMGTLGVTENIVDTAAMLCLCNEVGCRLEYLSGGALTITDLPEAKRAFRHFAVGPPHVLDYIRQTITVAHPDWRSTAPSAAPAS